MEQLKKDKVVISSEEKEDFVYEEYSIESIVNKINEIIELLNEKLDK